MGEAMANAWKGRGIVLAVCSFVLLFQLDTEVSSNRFLLQTHHTQRRERERERDYYTDWYVFDLDHLMIFCYWCTAYSDCCCWALTINPDHFKFWIFPLLISSQLNSIFLFLGVEEEEEENGSELTDDFEIREAIEIQVFSDFYTFFSFGFLLLFRLALRCRKVCHWISFRFSICPFFFCVCVRCVL